MYSEENVTGSGKTKERSKVGNSIIRNDLINNKRKLRKKENKDRHKARRRKKS